MISVFVVEEKDDTENLIIYFFFELVVISEYFYEFFMPLSYFLCLWFISSHLHTKQIIILPVIYIQIKIHLHEPPLQELPFHPQNQNQNIGQHHVGKPVLPGVGNPEQVLVKQTWGREAGGKGADIDIEEVDRGWGVVAAFEGKRD